ncbi:MAG: NifB/NifX family molybdenum-iron cluster-binding protein [Desulfobacterales bacterium]|jgi:predicted Fe-Mo cluster-binding NifX family protein
MKIAVSSKGKDLKSELDPRFGRCAFFLIVDPDDMSIEVFNNESGNLAGGAGIQAAQFVASKGVNAVITGNCGPNAIDTLAAAGIKLFVGQSGVIRDVVSQFKEGGLKPTDTATVDSHYGMSEEPLSEVSRSQAFVQGMGMGRGRGMGGGIRRSGLQAGEQTSSGEELGKLKKQVKDLNEKMKQIIDRIDQIKKD